MQLDPFPPEAAPPSVWTKEFSENVAIAVRAQRLSADVSGPLKVPGLDADARGAFPRPHKYLFVAKVRIPKTFVDDG